MIAIEAKHVNYAYKPGKTVLHDISFSLRAGESLYILGRNGSGKTTLLHCLAGLIKPNIGEVLLSGKTLDDYTASERARRIGLIPQIHIPSFNYSVKEMVLMGRAPHLGWLGSPTLKDYRLVEEALEQVGLSELQDQPYTEISGGERQLVLIARGLVQKCKILLMDEPTAHLDLSNQSRVSEIINQLTRQGLSFIVSSHEPNDALAYADNVLLLSGGWMTEFGPPKDTLTEPLLSAVYGIKTEVIFGMENNKAIPRAVVPLRPQSMAPESLMDANSPLSKVFEKSKLSSQLLLVTGLSGAGKTTWCSRLAYLSQKKGYQVVGVLSPGIYKGNQKVGIAIKGIHLDEQKQLAQLRETNVSNISTIRWSFDASALEWANEVLKNSPKGDLLIIDELGPLEFLRGQGLVSGLSRLDSGDYNVACVVVRSSLLPKALQRWPHALVVNGAENQ